MLTTFVVTVVGYLRELAEIVVVGFVVAGIINAVVNKEAVARYLGGSPVMANLLGATIGIVTPLCCCSGSLRRWRCIARAAGVDQPARS